MEWIGRPVDRIPWMTTVATKPRRPAPAGTRRAFEGGHGTGGLSDTGLRRDDEEMDGRANRKVEGRKGQKGVSPPQRLDQQVSQRNEDGAGKSAQERHGGDPAPGQEAEPALQDGEAGLVPRTALMVRPRPIQRATKNP